MCKYTHIRTYKGININEIAIKLQIAHKKKYEKRVLLHSFEQITLQMFNMFTFMKNKLFKLLLFFIPIALYATMLYCCIVRTFPLLKNAKTKL